MPSPTTTRPTVLHYTIIGTSTTIVEAWEPYANHSEMRSVRDDTGECVGWLGKVTARPLPSRIELMEPGSRQRIDAVIDWTAANVLEAIAAIDEAHPGLLQRDAARLDGGRVVLEGEAL